MKETNEMRDRLIHEFAEHYMEKLFYFCLKKTGKNTEAEDLTQDIAIQIITALNKGTIPTSFSAWVWQIARNRYSVWAKEKHNRNESLTGSDISDYEIEDESENILDEMIHTEQMALLRRELAFIKSDYRNIIVAYYIENRNVREIASSLSLPTNTVKSRLLRAREILKVGMDMAREFGKCSYHPENISFVMNGMVGKNDEPQNYISRLLCKNILLAAYRNPATAEELAMEVGVALPYMEEELSSLVDATLMKKSGNKYETNFFIVSADAQEKIYAHLLGIAPELTKAVIDTMDRHLPYDQSPGSYSVKENGKVKYKIDAYLTSNGGKIEALSSASWGVYIILEGQEICSFDERSVFRMLNGRFIIFSSDEVMKKGVLETLPYSVKSVLFTLED